MKADHGSLARQDRGGDEVQADLAHLFAEAGHFFVRDGARGFGRDITQCRAGAAGGEHEVTTLLVNQIDQRGFDHGLLVRDQALDVFAGREQGTIEPGFETGQALVRVDAGRGAVAGRDQAHF